MRNRQLQRPVIQEHGLLLEASGRTPIRPRTGARVRSRSQLVGRTNGV